VKLKWGNSLRVAWNGFNYWRKRYWPIRLFILVALAIPLLLENYILFGESTVNRIIRNACLSMQYSSRPQVVNAWLRYNHSLEKQRLLLSLKAIDNQLTAQERQKFNAKPSKADLKQLFTLAQKHGILPASTNLRDIKRSMLSSAVYETKLRFDPEYEKINKIIDNCKHPDYTSWSIWKNGFDNFINLLRVTIFPNSWKMIFSLFFLCFFSGAITNTLAPKLKELISILLGAGFTVTLICISRPSIHLTWGNDSICWFWCIFHDNYFMAYYISQTCLAAAAALLGCRIFERLNQQINIKISSIIAIYGLALAAIATGSAIHLDKSQYFWIGRVSKLSILNLDRKYIYFEKIFYGIGFIALAWASAKLYSLYKAKLTNARKMTAEAD